MMIFLSFVKLHNAYWLTQMIRATHKTSSKLKVRFKRSGLTDNSSMRVALLRKSCLANTSPSRVLTTTRSPRR
ncbi:hypothetical protein CCP2SC5_70065 [Azospirillaceae bacterium]